MIAMTKVLDKKEIGCRVKNLRIQKDIAQTELARAIGVSQTRWSNIETGKVGLTTDNLVKLAEVLDCSLDEILLGRKVNRQSKLDMAKEISILNEFTIGDVVRALQMLKMKEVKLDAWRSHKLNPPVRCAGGFSI